jgi:hypothetical protein
VLPSDFELFTLCLPISGLILFASMLLTSRTMGGVEFGSLSAVFLKGGFLLVAVNLIMLIPYGGWLTLPVWWLGLMMLFRIDFWEARVLVIINWALNSLFRVFLLATFLPT